MSEMKTLHHSWKFSPAGQVWVQDQEEENFSDSVGTKSDQFAPMYHVSCMWSLNSSGKCVAAQWSSNSGLWNVIQVA